MQDSPAPLSTCALLGVTGAVIIASVIQAMT